MYRNSTTLYLISPGAISPVPWVNDAPDLRQFTDPTLSVLEQSWQAFLDSGEELEIIPDPEPVAEPPVLDWDGLYQGLMVSTVYPLLVGIGQQISGVDGALDKTIDAIQYGIILPSSVAALPAFQSAINLLLTVLNAVGQPLTTEQLAEVRAILDANNFQVITLQ